MARRFYGINKGQDYTKVAEASSTGSQNVEVNVDLAVPQDKGAILLQLDQIKQYILSHNWPPA
jgi:hypothetical protein